MGKSKGGSSEKNYKIHLQEIHDRIDLALEKAKLTKSQRQVYRRSLFEVIHRLGPGGLARLHKYACEFRFYKSQEALTQAIKQKYPGVSIKPGMLFKGMFDKDGTIHLDGEGKLFGIPATLEQFQAHEIAHAIDGHHELSSIKEWHTAWEGEIADGGYLGKHSMGSPQEGWADFGTLVMGTDISARKIKEVMPRAFTFWSERGLL